ncbi:MAG: hypothetical protein JWP64_5083 [Pseudonocardia sp.]|jgi:hypothetical protein|uniref:DUF4192 domain-containing protein n=1 Tax=Pseudonocardia sp. TaxID=60912 RepID=UPI002632EF47|nr:DUF4192 domain-containing protein [Pseudonocardia sp.]MCU1630134.1 hypothetical protein [Pseudonocardia sp.]MDT7701272.1 hypothetical protein [Pseudonocardiales bacterium]
MTAAPAPLDSSDPPPLRVRDPGELIAAIPVLLGFHPRDSVVLVGTGGPSGRRIGLTLRVDLPPPGVGEDLAVVCETAADAILNGDPASVAVVVVQGGGGPAHPRRGEAATAMVAALAVVGLRAHTVVWAGGTAAGDPWACYPSVDPCGCTGAVPDPSSTPLAAAAVARGTVVRASREELEQQVVPASRDVLARRAKERDRWTDEARTSTLAEHWTALQAALDDAAACRLMVDDALVLALSAALEEPAVRDIALAACAGSQAPAAEQLWAALARETPAPEAAEPAALLAVSALLRGDGALANIALERAHRACPGHRLALLLRQALDSGMGPVEIRRWLEETTLPRDLRREDLR